MPKVVFFYLTWIASLACALIATVASDGGPPEGPLGLIWVGVFFFNLLVISFDFNEERSLIAVFGLIAAVLALLYFGVLGSVGTWLSSLRPAMDATFYWLVFAGFSLIYAVVWLNSRFDYWIFRPNEVIHRYGIFPKMKRFSTEDLRFDKEVPDVLERLLLGAGRLILTTPHEKHPVVIEHVLRIGRIDDEIAEILGVKAVVERGPTRE
ncbi:MAG: hypothetical protein D6702_00180 [Planctomycetota bacterium]|nr:MAG: hypothetical protein D6702_00180 [Planctomycetota bacterium]